MTIHHPSDPALFGISVDLDKRLIRYKFTQLWDRETFAICHESILAEMKKFQMAGTPFDMIGDLTEFPPQPQVLNDLREDSMRTLREMGLRKWAVIVANSISKLQLGRLSGDSCAFFTSEREALAWIAE